MYRDKTLIPTEAIRLCALGTLAGGPKRYSELANDVRYFSSHVVGPSLDLLGPSIELLRYEGLAEAEDAGGDVGTEGEAGEDVLLTITEKGQAELKELLCSNVRTPVDDINKLVVALKFRFLHLLEPAEGREQVDGLIDMCRAEHGRLADLRGQPPGDGGNLAAWLDHDMGQLEARIAWLEEYRGNF
jgi:DNA-binding PadR family transcriptional regulator